MLNTTEHRISGRVRMVAVAAAAGLLAVACSGGASSPNLGEVAEAETGIEGGDGSTTSSEFCDLWGQTVSAVGQLAAEGTTDGSRAVTQIRASLDALVVAAPDQLVADVTMFDGVTRRLTEVIEESGYVVASMDPEDQRAQAASAPEFLTAAGSLADTCGLDIDLAAIGGLEATGADTAAVAAVTNDGSFPAALMDTYSVDEDTANCLADELNAMDQGEIETAKFADPNAEICGVPLRELIGIGAE